MKKRQTLFLLSVSLFLLLACQVLRRPASLADRATAQQPTASPTPILPTPPVLQRPPLPPIIAQTDGLYSSAVVLKQFQPQAYQGLPISLPLSIDSLPNAGVVSGLTESQLNLLRRNGFVVVPTTDAQFDEIRTRVAIQHGQPYFLTTDSAYHALHLGFDELLKAFEREYLRPQMIVITRAMLDNLLGRWEQVRGTELEQDTRLAAAYLAVALKLFDPQSPVDARLQGLVDPQVAQILAAQGRSYSSLLPNFEDDYGAYKPVGHYAGDPDLEAYFQGMTWFGRVSFQFKDQNNPAFVPSRAPLLLTYALREARTPQGTPVLQIWVQIHETLTYLIGPLDDPGPVELSALMDEVYGDAVSFPMLADQILWKAFLVKTESLPGPQINSTFVASLKDLSNERGWRFQGQRFTLDSFIMQNLVYDLVGTPEKKRQHPSGLDVMAALGSSAALQALEQAGETEYANYPQQLSRMQQAVQAQPQNDWLSRFYSGWLYAFQPQLAEKGESYPAFMRTAAWGHKDMNSALGSWAELKHDTALYTKMPEFAGGGGPPASGPAPVYVEPLPDVYYRLAYITRALADGIRQRGMDMTGVTGKNPYAAGDLSFSDLLNGMSQLAGRLDFLGDMAQRELKGEPFSEDERWALQSCLGPVECTVLQSRLYGQEQEMPPIPLTAVVAGAGENQVLQVGIGGLNRIYVVVPIDGRLEIAQGGVFTYYEFIQPRAERLNDADWRLRLAVKPPAPSAWLSQYSASGGYMVDVTAFRKGDTYLVTPAGANLNLRATPSLQANILRKLDPDTYVTILDGPIQAEKYTWWKVRVEMVGMQEGWVVEDQDWYVRAWGQ